MLGVYLQRSWIVLAGATLLTVPLYVLAEPLLLAVGQDPVVAREAGCFALYILPAAFSFAVNFPGARFPQAQSKVVVLAWIGAAGLCLHVALTYLLVAVLGWGSPAVAAAYDISLWAIALGQAAYIIGWCEDSGRGWSMAAFDDMWAFVRLSLQSAIMLCLEIWYISMITVVTGHLKDAEMAVDSLGICMNVNGWEATFFVGLNAAISVRVSNELGSGRPKAAMHAVVVVVAQSLLIRLVCMLLVLLFRDRFSIIYTSDVQLQHAVSKIAGLLGATMVLNSVQLVISGVAIGGGWQGLVAYINLGCYYAFELPLGYLLGYKFNYGVWGIWSGMLCGIALQTLILLSIVWRTDWTAEDNQVREDFIPKENMAFVTDEEGYEFYQQYARAAGFGITKLKRKPMSRLYACSRGGAGTFYKPGEERKRAKMSKKINCKAAVKIKKKGKEWIYEKVMLEHNHTLNPNPSELKHMYSHKNKDPIIMELVDDLQTCDVSPNTTMNVLTKFHGNYEVMPMNDRDILNRRASNVLKERADDVKKLRAFFNEFRAHNSKFYYDIEDDSEGVTKNIFWSHASCQANYAEFGDVVTFDTTYKGNFYKMPLAMFVGSNHHLQNVIFGFALLRDETEETFKWAFQTFKTCMGDKEPHCILTDQDVAMEKALPHVFPNTLHRLCRWHVWERHKDDLKVLFNLHDGLKEKLQTAINHPLTPLEFESAWKDMVNEYGLESDPTISSLYDQRARWIAAYFKAVYCGRMTSTQRSESMNRLVKRHHVDPTTPLHQFARKMYLVLQKRKEAEGRETIACQGRPETITNYPLEHQLSRIYTRAVFKKYKEAYVYGTSFLIKKVDAGRFLVVYGRDGPKFSWSQHEFRVVCDEEKEEYKCECMQWEHTGLLCPHLIIVMTNEQIQRLPSKYVLRRYTRNARIGPPYDRNDTLQVGADGTTVSVKHFNMLREAFACVRAGDRSTVAYERVMNVLKELRAQVEVLPADVMPVFDEGGCSGTADCEMINCKAPPISKTKGSRSEEGERHIGARGPKKCTRRCGKCGLKSGHNKASCKNQQESIAIGGARGGRGRGRGRTGRGRGRGRETATRRRLIHDEVEEEQDVQSEDDVVDGESSRRIDDSD